MKKDYHHHSDYYLYTGVHKKIEGIENHQYKCSMCDKIIWLQKGIEYTSVSEKVEEPKDELSRWEV